MTFTKLITRLSEMDGPDRKLDAEIVKHLGLENECPFWLHRFTQLTPVRITASIDAAISLAERVLPGWNGDLDIGKPISDSGKLGCRIWTPASGIGNYAGEGFNSATSLVIAILKAKEAERS